MSTASDGEIRESTLGSVDLDAVLQTQLDRLHDGSIITALGASTLYELAGAVPDDPNAKLTFVAGFLQLCEAYDTILAPRALQPGPLPGEVQPGAIRRLPLQASGETASRNAKAATDVVLGVVSSPAAGEDCKDGEPDGPTSLVEESLDPGATAHTPPQESAASPLTPNQNALSFTKALLKTSILPPAVTQEALERLVGEATVVYSQARLRGNPGQKTEALVRRRREEIALYIQGRPTGEVAELTNAVSEGAVQQGRVDMVARVHARGYSPQYWQSRLTELLSAPNGTAQSETVDEAESPLAGEPHQPENAPTEENTGSDDQAPKEPSENVANEESSEPDAPEDKPLPTVQDVFKEPQAREQNEAQAVWSSALDTCRPFWREDDLKSLEALLNNKSGEEVILARRHLLALMGTYAQWAGDNTDVSVLTKPEWEALNLLTGFRVQQGQNALSPNLIRLRTKVVQACKKLNITADEAIGNGIQKLIKKAAPDYQNGWYPGIAKAKASAPRGQSGAAPGQPAPASKKRPATPEANTQGMETVLASLLKGLPVSQTGRAQLLLHLGEKMPDTELNTRELKQALWLLAPRIDNAIRNAQAAWKNDAKGAELILPNEQRLLKLIIGDQNGGLEPKSYQKLQSDKLLLQRLNRTPEELRATIIDILRKVAQANPTR